MPFPDLVKLFGLNEGQFITYGLVQNALQWIWSINDAEPPTYELMNSLHTLGVGRKLLTWLNNTDFVTNHTIYLEGDFGRALTIENGRGR